LAVTPLRSAFVLAFTIFGCNTILDNTPGRPREEPPATDVPATEPTVGPAEAGTPVSNPPRTRDAGAPLRPSECPDGLRSCDGRCVGNDDPTYGCGDPRCTPCAIAHGSATCAAGACAVATCDAGWDNCNASANDGCETDLSLAASCGSCTNACPATAPICAPNGANRECTTGCPLTAPLLCGGTCVAPLTSTTHCGGCDRPCPEVPKATSQCVLGQCTFTCRAGFHACNGQCVPKIDPAACGPTCAACPAAPNASPACTNDACTFTCAAGFADCNLAPADGCETNIQADPLHCGGCGSPCAGTCVDGLCRPGDGG